MSTISLAQWMRFAFSPTLVKRSINTAIVVGSLLNLINQRHAIFGEADILWVNLLLTYLVPYCVSTYSGAMSTIANQENLKQGNHRQ